MTNLDSPLNTKDALTILRIKSEKKKLNIDNSLEVLVWKKYILMFHVALEIVSLFMKLTFWNMQEDTHWTTWN